MSIYFLIQNLNMGGNLSETESNASYILQGLLKIKKQKQKYKTNTVANYCCLPMSAEVMNNKKVIVMMTFIVTLTCFKNTIREPSLFVNQAE